MMRKRARTVTQQVSLFPFLAVLICTMGVLIVLLVLVAKQADLNASEAREAASAEQQEQLRELKVAVEDAEFRSEELLAFRPMAVEQIQKHKQMRSHLEDQKRLLKEQLQQLENQWTSLQNHQDPASTELESQVRFAENRLEEMRRDLTRTREAASNKPVRTAVVAYDGRSGTRRRPIYIECRPDGIHLQPYDILLTVSDFTDPVLPGNPLDAAILAIREHWQKLDPTQSQGAPYPLILVRPGGSNAYALARQAMKSWDSEFGHQIIPEAMTLDFPPVDPQFSEQLDWIIADAIRKQNRLVAPGGSLARVSGGRGGDSFGGGSSEGKGLPSAAYSSSRTQLGSKTSPGTPVPETIRATGRRGGFVSDRRNMGASTGSGDGSSERNETLGSTPLNAPLTSTSRGNYSSNGTPGASAGGEGSSLQARGSDTGVSVPANTNSHGNGSSASETRGNDWALPTRTEGAIAYRRPIKVSCYADRLVIHGSQVERKTDIVLNHSSSLQTILDPMVEAIWARIDSWGVAGFNSYWRPELQVQVEPGGEQAFTELKRLLSNSGLGVRRLNP
jgi:biopolymer transport protein ExbD